MARRSLADWLARRAALPTWDDKIEEPIPVRLVEVTDSAAARQNLLNTSGQVTEANSSTISSRTLNAGYFQVEQDLHFSSMITSVATAYDAAKHRIMAVDISATAGGEIASTAIVPALAGYQSCCMLQYIWSDQTDGSINLAFATTSGLSTGPATINIATTANAISPDYTPGGIYFQGSADNEAINISAAAGQTGASQAFQICGVYWYET